MALSSKAQATYVDGIRYNVIDTVSKTCEVLYETFEENNGVRNIYSSSYRGNIVIPEKVEMYDGTYTVVAISEQAFRNSEVTHVKLPNTIKTIGLGAFYGAARLCEITIPASVTEIGPSAFEGCRYLDTVVMGENVNKIGSCAFFGCV